MSKIKAFLAKPITWGAYFKLYGLSLAVTAAIVVGELAWLTHGITWGKGSKEEDEEKPAYSWADEDKLQKEES